MPFMASLRVTDFCFILSPASIDRRCSQLNTVLYTNCIREALMSANRREFLLGAATVAATTSLPYTRLGLGDPQTDASERPSMARPRLFLSLMELR